MRLSVVSMAQNRIRSVALIHLVFLVCFTGNTVVTVNYDKTIDNICFYYYYDNIIIYEYCF